MPGVLGTERFPSPDRGGWAGAGGPRDKDREGLRASPGTFPAAR
jgi:hypothetical protein